MFSSLPFLLDSISFQGSEPCCTEAKGVGACCRTPDTTLCSLVSLLLGRVPLMIYLEKSVVVVVSSTCNSWQLF